MPPARREYALLGLAVQASAPQSGLGFYALPLPFEPP